MTTPLDNQELDREISSALKVGTATIQEGVDAVFDTQVRQIKQLVLAQAHRIGNLVIGEDPYEEKHIMLYDLEDTMLYAENKLRKEQRKKLSTLTGVRE